jgi:ethanolamine ammonia-lyase large subunit
VNHFNEYHKDHEFTLSCGKEMTLAHVLGSANERKEGDEIVGLAAPNESVRLKAREWLANVSIQVR